MVGAMGEPENRRQRQLMGDALEGCVDEEIVSAYYGMREDAWGDSWKKGPRWIKRRLASGHPADDTGTINVLVLTPTRVMVFNAKPKAPLLEIRRKIADWPVGAVRLESKGMKATSHYKPGQLVVDAPHHPRDDHLGRRGAPAHPRLPQAQRGASRCCARSARERRDRVVGVPRAR